MTKLELARNELERMNVFAEYKNRTMNNMSKILGEDVPIIMAQTIANYTMASFVGHFHFKIALSENNLIPMNMISFILAKSGAKKAQPLSEPVLTPNGFVQMGDIEEGDYVIGRNGKPTKVLAVVPQGKRKVFEIELIDGSTTRCDEEHLWYVAKRNGNMTTLQTKDMINDFLIERYDARYGTYQNEYKYRLPRAKPAEFSTGENNYIHPYLLGLLLGDGHLGEDKITFSNASEDIINKIGEMLPKGTIISQEKFDRGCWNISLVKNIGNIGEQGKSTLYTMLKDLDLIGQKSVDKFIPENYLNASKVRRKALFDGLMDTDGWTTKYGKKGFGSSSKKLAEQTKWLGKSLGIVWGKLGSHIPKYEYKGIEKDGAEFYQFTERTGRTDYDSIVNIRELDYEEEMQCIKIEAQDQLYITKDFIVTHNTSSVTKLKKVIQPGLDVINITRSKRMTEKCERLDIPVPKLNPLSNSLGTEPGLIKRLNEFMDEGIGLPSMFVDEIATELAVNVDMVPNIKLVAQLFDEGSMESKPLKDSENQSQEVKGMGMTALFIGSEYGILEDNIILDKFNMEFISKLSRRCFFVYPGFEEIATKAETIDDLLEEIQDAKDSSKELEANVGGTCQAIAVALKDKDINLRKLDEETARLYEIYRIYCEEMAKLISSEQINLEQQHRHWKALKLAGVYSIFNLHGVIKKQDLLEAIYIAELGSDNLERFLIKAERNAHEKLLEHYLDEAPPLSVHDILKRKWIKKVIEIEDLIRFANSKLGNVGVFKLENDYVVLEKFVETEGVACSYKMCSGTKNERKYKIVDGFKFARAPFVDMAKILSNDTAYTNFEFRDGIRGKEYVVGSADYVVLDIDNTDITDTECSEFLADYRHIICRTSDAENPYKYRVVIPTDIAVDITNEQFPHFMKKVGEHLGMDIDILPKAQIYYGYKNRTPIIYEDGEDLEASELIKGLHIPKVEIKKLPADKLKKVYQDRMRIMEWFYFTGDDAPPGSPAGRSSSHNTLWLASVHLHDIGADFSTAEAIIMDIEDFRSKKVRPGYIEQLVRRMKTYDRWTNAQSVVLGETNEQKEDGEYKY